MIAVRFGHLLELGDDAAARLGLGKAEVDGLLVRRDLDPFDALQFLDAALHLLGLGGLVAESVDKHFQLFNTFALVAIRSFQLLPTLRLLGSVFVVIARVEVNALIPDFDDLIDGHVQKVAVVRNEHKRIGVILEVIFQPITRFEIKMVGRFVEEQQIRLLEKQFGQRNSHLPAARKFLGAAFPIALRKPQAGEHRTGLRFNGITIAGTELAFSPVESFRHPYGRTSVAMEALVIRHRHSRFQKGNSGCGFFSSRS